MVRANPQRNSLIITRLVTAAKMQALSSSKAFVQRAAPARSSRMVVKASAAPAMVPDMNKRNTMCAGRRLGALSP